MAAIKWELEDLACKFLWTPRFDAHPAPSIETAAMSDPSALDRQDEHGHYGQMKRASVSEAKNGLSGLLSEVRRGESVLITHRGRPVARIEPCRVAGPDAEDAISELLQRGVAAPPRAPLDVERFLGVPAARLTGGVSASGIVVAERGARR